MTFPVGPWVTNTTASNVNSLSVSKSGTLAGDLLVLIVSWSGTQTPTVAGMTSANIVSAPGSNGGVALWFAAGIAGGNVTFTAVFPKSALGLLSLALAEGQGFTTTPLSQTQGQAQTSVTSFTSGNAFTPIAANCLAIGFTTHASVNTTSVGAGYTPEIVTEALQPLAVEYQQLSGTPSINAQFTVATSDTGATGLALFFPAATLSASLSLGVTSGMIEAPAAKEIATIGTTLGLSDIGNKRAAANVSLGNTMGFSLAGKPRGVVSLGITSGFNPSRNMSARANATIGVLSGFNLFRTSATSGYLVPLTTNGELNDEPLRVFFQQLIAGVTNLPGNMVRPRWQPEPPNMPAASVNWCAIGVVSRERDVNALVTHQGDSDLVYRTEILSVVATFYGPQCEQLSELFAMGLEVAQNREVMQQAGYGLVEVQNAVMMAEQYNERWITRVDVDFKVRRAQLYQYPVLDLEGATGTITATDGVSTITVDFETP